MERVFTISDIHGCAETFKALVENVIQLRKDDKLILLGDYINRGPSSKGVIDYIMYLHDNGYNVTALKGNHEQMLLKSCYDLRYRETFLSNGGDSTLRNFGVTNPCELPEKYFNFINGMGYYTSYEKFILVHAGINTNAEAPFEDIESMLWTRNFSVDGIIKDCFVVHGHTPKPLFEIQNSIQEIDKYRKVDIDNGCVLKSKEGYGNLCCLELNSLSLHYQPNIDF